MDVCRRYEVLPAPVRLDRQVLLSIQGHMMATGGHVHTHPPLFQVIAPFRGLLVFGVFDVARIEHMGACRATWFLPPKEDQREREQCHARRVQLDQRHRKVIHHPNDDLGREPRQLDDEDRLPKPVKRTLVPNVVLRDLGVHDLARLHQREELVHVDLLDARLVTQRKATHEDKVTVCHGPPAMAAV